MPDIEIQDLASIQRLAATIETLPSTLGSALRASDGDADQRIHRLKRGVDRLSDALRHAERALDQVEEDEDPSDLYQAIEEIKDQLARLEEAVSQAARASARHAVAREGLEAASSRQANAATAFLREKLKIVQSLQALTLDQSGEGVGEGGASTAPTPDAQQNGSPPVDEKTRETLHEYLGQVDTALTYASVNPRLLTDQERLGLAAVRYYTNYGYVSMNSNRRAGLDNKAADLADSALTHTDILPKYRGFCRRNTKFREELESLYAEGRVIRHNELFSSSSEYLNADEFAAEAEKKIIYFIKSRNGREVSRVSYHSSENEILFPGGTPFRVLKVKTLDSHLVVFLSEQ